jgi:hypothetical protein
MGAVGSAFDNAMMESFWGRLQVELLNRRRWKTRIELASAIHDYIELWHNTRRRHSSLAMRTPAEVEHAWAASKHAMTEARRFEWNTRTMPHLGVVYGIARDVTVRTALAEEQAALRRVATLVARERPPEEGFASVAKELGRVLGERADRGAHARCGYRLGRRRADRRRGADLARDDRGNEGVRSVAHRHRRSASPLARCTTTISARSPRTLMRRLSPGSRTQTAGGQRDRKG